MYLKKAFTISILIAVSVARLATAEAASCDTQCALQRYLAGKPKATIAAFDHVALTWTIWGWDGCALERVKGPTEKPELTLRNGEQLYTLVVNTNPLIFTADRTSTAEADIDSLALLKDLAAGLGGIAAASLVVDSIPAPSQPRSIQSPGGPEASPASAPKSPELDALVFDYVSSLSIPQIDLKEIGEAAALIENIVAEADEKKILAWLQAYESDLDPAQRPSAPEANLSDLNKAFGALSSAKSDLDAAKVACAISMSATSEAASIGMTHIDPEKASERLEAYIKAATAMRRDLDKQGCGMQLKAATEALSKWFLKNLPTAAGPSPDEKRSLGELYAGLWPVLEVVKKRADAIAKADAMAKTEPAAILAISRLSLFHDRLASQPSGVDASFGILEIPRSSFEGKVIPWSKKRTDTVQVAIDASLSDKLTLRHPKSAEGSFTVERKFAQNLDVDLAVVRTDLYSPTFEAKDLDGMEGGESTIIEKDRSTRSGGLAILMAYRFPLSTSFSIGPQLGVGVEKDDAAFFYGASLKWRFISVGWGQTRQKIESLSDGLSIGDVLQAGEALTTRDRFETDDFWSLSISITDLPFFKKKE